MTRLDTRTHRAWTRDNPVLADGELVAEKETGRLKIGDGVTQYNLLPFVNAEVTRDKIESKLYGRAYKWECVPGSDVRATDLNGLGPIAVTDENACGLIGDVAYVVSGYIYNTFSMQFPSLPVQTNNDVNFHAGDLAKDVSSGAIYRCTSDFDMRLATGTVAEHLDHFELVGSSSPDFWPYIERFNMKTKTWLPRIPLPELSPGVTWAGEGGFAGVIGDKLYFGGGDGDDITGEEFFVYDPADDSITRLADCPADYVADYAPYGVVADKLWYFTGGKAVCYDPVANSWAALDYSGDNGVDGYDQISGWDWNGKLIWLIRGSIYIFDPVTMSEEYPGDAPDYFGGTSFLINDKLECFTADSGVSGVLSDGGEARTYDPATNTWTTRTDQVNYLRSLQSEMAWVVYNNTPYALSALGNRDTVGVYGLTGRPTIKPNLPSEEAAAITKQFPVEAAANSLAHIPWEWLRVFVDLQGYGIDPVMPLMFMPVVPPEAPGGQMYWLARTNLTGYQHYTGDNQPMSICTGVPIGPGYPGIDKLNALLAQTHVDLVEIRLVDIDTGAALSYRWTGQQPAWDETAPVDPDGNYRAHALKLTTSGSATPQVDIAGAGGVHLTDGIAYDPTTRRITNKPGYRGRIMWTLFMNVSAPQGMP